MYFFLILIISPSPINDVQPDPRWQTTTVCVDESALYSIGSAQREDRSTVRDIRLTTFQRPPTFVTFPTLARHLLNHLFVLPVDNARFYIHCCHHDPRNYTLFNPPSTFR